MQSNYCSIEIFNGCSSFLKNNIDTKDGYEFDKLIRENLGEFQYAFKYVHQTLTIVKKDKIINQR